jgi:hypothetical protein
MTSFVRNVIGNAIRDEKKKNILVAPYNGVFEYLLSRYIPHNFYYLGGMQYINELPITQNVISPNPNEWPLFFDADLIICNHIEGQLQVCQQLSQILHIPLLIIHHGLPSKFVKNQDKIVLFDTNRQNTRVVLDREINKAWFAEFNIIPDFIDKFDDNPLTDTILAIAGNYDNNIIGFIKQIEQGIQRPINIVKPKTYDEAINAIKNCGTYLSFDNGLDRNGFMLSVMALGRRVITTPSTLNTTVVQNQYNGYIADNPYLFTKIIKENINFTVLNNAKITAGQFETGFDNAWTQLIEQTLHKAFRI